MGSGWGPGPDVMAGIRGVKSKEGPDLIVWGSSTLTSVLLEQGLVDEVLLLSTRSCWAGANAAFRTAPTRANSLLSARRPRRRGCSSTRIGTLDRCEAEKYHGRRFRVEKPPAPPFQDMD